MRSIGGARSRATGLLAAALLLLSSAAFVVPDVKGIVTGGIIPCSALYVPSNPHYAAGTVTVLKGHVSLKSTEQGNSTIVFPSDLAAQQRVETNTTYRFVLEPGQYVLQAGNAFTTVTLQPSDDLFVDIPNVCI
jgi:uncharacterized membrane protein